MNEHERRFKEAIKEREYEFAKSGWPDFALLTSKNELVLVEVKDHNDDLRPSQKKMFELLKKAGIQTYVSYDGLWPLIPFQDMGKKPCLDLTEITEKDRGKIISYLNSKIASTPSGSKRLRRLYRIVRRLEQNESVIEVIEQNQGLFQVLNEESQ